MTKQNFCYVAAVARDSHWWISLLTIVGMLVTQLVPAYAYTTTHRSAEQHCPEEADATPTPIPVSAVPVEVVADCDQFGSCDGRCCHLCQIAVGIGSSSVAAVAPWVSDPAAMYPALHPLLLVFRHNRPPSPSALNGERSIAFIVNRHGG